MTRMAPPGRQIPILEFGPTLVVVANFLGRLQGKWLGPLWVWQASRPRRSGCPTSQSWRPTEGRNSWPTGIHPRPAGALGTSGARRLGNALGPGGTCTPRGSCPGCRAGQQAWPGGCLGYTGCPPAGAHLPELPDSMCLSLKATIFASFMNFLLS